MGYKEDAKELVLGLDQKMGPSSYDIGWMARLTNSANKDHWADLLDWLLENQRPDGSWGGEVVYYHDRIICTLVAAIALRESGRRQRDLVAIKRAENYLWHHLHLLRRDPFELVGFELIFPTLLIEAASLGLDVPTHTCGYGEIQAAKLSLIPQSLLYSPNISTVHSLEFLGRAGDVKQLKDALAVNGSLGNSPAATAYYLLLCPGDERALGYLNSVRANLKQVIYLYPFRNFELSWVLNNLSFCDLPLKNFATRETLDTLSAAISSTGIGLDSTFNIVDGDITAVSSRLLINAGYDIDPNILHQFENPKTHIFRTYEYERNISVGTNIHALEALRSMPDYPNRSETQEQLRTALLTRRIYDVYWIDKWHASPYYGTLHALVGLLKDGPAMLDACAQTAEWIMHTQRSDGSWGFFPESTAEETAYALTALLYYHRYKPINLDILHRAAAYLAYAYLPYHYNKTNMVYPELWIGKCLYAPYDVIRSAILAALILYNETFGTSTYSSP